MLFCLSRAGLDLNSYPAKLIYFNFQPLEVVPRYRDSQPQVVENYPFLFNILILLLMFKQSFH